MRIEKLQVGDWYQWDDYPYQMTKDIFASDDATINCLEPIPITPELLKKNGWRFDEIDGAYYNLMNVYGREAPFSIFDGVSINYIHQLQQALRLVGLNDLANNFKI